MPRHWIASVAVLSVLSAPGCDLFRSACHDAMPAVVRGQGLVADAQLALEQAQQVIRALPADRALKAQAALERAQDALRAATATLDAASSACTAADLQGAFRAFSEAWAILRALLPAVCGVGGTRAVEDPLAYSLGAQR